MLDKEMKEYRRKHKKCQWCKYFNARFIPCGFSEYLFKSCILKDKDIHGNWRAKFCKYYRIDKEENKNESKENQKD